MVDVLRIRGAAANLLDRGTHFEVSQPNLHACAVLKVDDDECVAEGGLR